MHLVKGREKPHAQLLIGWNSSKEAREMTIVKLSVVKTRLVDERSHKDQRNIGCRQPSHIPSSNGIYPTFRVTVCFKKQFPWSEKAFEDLSKGLPIDADNN